MVATAAGCGEPGGDGGDEDASTSCTTQMYATYGDAGFEAVVAKILQNIGTVSAMNPSPIGDSFKNLNANQVVREVLDFLESRTREDESG